MSDERYIGKREKARTAVGIQGRYRSGSGVPRDVWVTDLSQNGCRFFDRFGTMQKGKSITIRIGNVGPIPATVRWWDNHVNGIAFDQPLHDSVYAHICANLSETPPEEIERWEDEQ